MEIYLNETCLIIQNKKIKAITCKSGRTWVYINSILCVLVKFSDSCLIFYRCHIFFRITLEKVVNGWWWHQMMTWIRSLYLQTTLWLVERKHILPDAEFLEGRSCLLCQWWSNKFKVLLKYPLEDVNWEKAAMETHYFMKHFLRTDSMNKNFLF